LPFSVGLHPSDRQLTELLKIASTQLDIRLILSFPDRAPISRKAMSFNPTLEQQEQLVDSNRLARKGLTGPERLGEWIVGIAYVAATAALLVAAPPSHFDLAPALLCMALMVIASRVQFDTPFGFTVATQLAFVPLLFAMPASLVPVAVPIALVIAGIPDVVSGETAPSRLVTRVGNSWFAVGPAAVFVIADTAPRDAGATLLIAALAAQFAGDFAASAVRFRLGRSATLLEHLKSSWVYVIDAALSGIALIVAEAIQPHPIAPLALLPLFGLLAVFAHERRDRLEGLIELNNAYHGTALVLGNVVEADDGYTGEHSRGVVALCLEVAAKLNLSAEQRRNLEFGALLHDVGKIAIPKEIINKPGKLDPAEWSIIRTHTIEGQKLLDTVGGFMRDVGLIVRSHHERWDGGGYPDGVAGEQIPLESRIISACDTWNAMRTHRSYRRALPFEDAAAEMRSIAGSQLDPRIVSALIDVVAAERPRASDQAAA
jgi:HD-GYP domain-containing protein (c-di-GMP phosphodiesterase class II)